ncbi:MAG: LamG domain-containing protein, partial [Gammaproteobacteria bacterium]|nr:LamG domain-containing protein [Gammaproteobacteria bacterium]
MVGNPERINIPAHATEQGVDCFGNNLAYGSGYPAKPLPVESLCRVFNGVDQYVDTGLTPSATGFIECVFNASAIGGTSKIIVGSSDNPATSRCYIAITPDGEISGGLGGDNASVILGNSTITQGLWYTAKLQWDGSSVNLYLNGALEYTGAQNGSPDTSLNLYVGKSNSVTFPAPFNGEVADVKINGVSIPFNNLGSYDIASDGTLVSYINNPTSALQDVVHRELREGFF